MKLLIFSPYYPPHIGGLESHADEFNKYLSQKGVDITVFTPRLPEIAPELEVKHNQVSIIRFPAFEIISNYPLPKFWSLKFWRLFFNLFKENFAIVISRTRFFNTSILALVYAKIKKVRWIHIEHGSDFVSLNNSLFSQIAKLYDYTFGKLVLKLSDLNIANSIASAEFCKKLAKGKKCEVIYRGVEIETIESILPNQELRDKYPNEIIITFLGRLIDGKGVSDLINAVKNIQENYKLFIIGDGPQKSNLEKLAKDLGISDKIIFFGYKKLEEAIGILKISDIFVNPSYNEGLPSSVIEATLCRKAIIATNVGGTPEIFANEKSGFLIEPKKIEQLKEKMETLMRNKNLRESMSISAYQEVKNKFNWNNNILKYLEVFEKVKSLSKKKIYILSSRHGGPYKQHCIIAEGLRKNGFWVDHQYNLWGWIKLHFVYGKNRTIITNVPLLLRFTSKNFIFNIKGNYTKEKSITKNPLGYLYGINKLWSEKIVLPSNYLKEVLNINNAIVIPNAVSEKLIIEGQKEKPTHTSNKINLIMVTMFGFREKSEGVLKAISGLSKVKTDKKVELNIFGKGSFENEIKQRSLQIKMPENIKVNFRGYAENINEEYRKSDIFIYWSDLDVMPNVFLEAMAFGLPIITNNFPSFQEILKNHNFISKNKQEFSFFLENLINDKEELEKIGKLNKNLVIEYNINNAKKYWLRFFI